MNKMVALDRDYFKSKKNPEMEKSSHLTECCGMNTDRLSLNKDVPKDWELIEEHCESRLNSYNKFKSITPIFCEDCDRLLEYRVELLNKKTW